MGIEPTGRGVSPGPTALKAAQGTSPEAPPIVRIGYAIEGVKIANEGESPSGDGSRMSGIPSAPEGKTHKCELKLFWTAVMMDD